MSSIVAISVALATIAFFVWHCVDRVTDEQKQKRIATEMDKVKEELREAIENGNLARAGQLKRRLHELMAQ